MAEIKLPVRVERSWISHEFGVWDADGRHVAGNESEQVADAIAAALNENAALRAQVARVCALAEGWQSSYHADQVMAALDGKGGGAQ